MIDLVMKYKFLGFVLAASLSVACHAEPVLTDELSSPKPNIVIIYADDLGIGDVSSYFEEGSLKTPNIDKLAAQGVRFENGYAAAATCTPSRYALLTGVYPWRNSAAKILPGDAPLLIDPASSTLPKMLKGAGYATAVIGKWHLGLGQGDVDWNSKITPGANEVGFDYSYIMAATNDRVPQVYVKNGSVVGLDPEDPLEVSYSKNFPGEPTGIDNPELLTKMKFSNGHYHSVNNGISRIGYQRGGKAAQWIDEDMADLFLDEVKRYTLEHKDEPFFLFYSLHQPHVPRVPHQRFAGKSGLGPRGDAILEADWAIGAYMEYLAEIGLAENTLVIFSSDNGPVLDDGYEDQAEELNGKHKSAGQYRGGKYSILNGGTHVPFIVNWPGTIKPTVSSALVSHLDIMASLSNLVNQKQSRGDGIELLDTLLGKSEAGRESIVLEGTRGKHSYREGDWVLIPPYWGPTVLRPENVETGYCSCYQLYNIKADPGQTNNLADKHSGRVKAMMTSYESITDQSK